MNYRHSIRPQNLIVFFLFNFVLLPSFLVPVAFAATLPTLPQKYVDTTYITPTGPTCTAANSSAFQTCLNNAPLNSTIVLTAGTTYSGPFTLPKKTSGSGWIYIVSSNLSSLPSAGTRVSPSDSTNMPKVVIYQGSGNWEAVNTVDGSHHYRFVGIEFKPATGSPKITTAIVGIGVNGGALHITSSESEIPTDIVFDRCYFHGNTSTGTRRALWLDAIRGAVIDSYFNDILDTSDAQDVLVLQTPGPIKLVNNYFGDATECVNFGGALIRVPNLVPSDIEIRYNTFAKNLNYYGQGWLFKQLLEFKNAQRVLIEGNYFLNNKDDDPNHFALTITPRNQTGNEPWARTRDITVRYNKFSNISHGFSIMGVDHEAGTSQGTLRIHIHDNLFAINSSYSSTCRVGIFLSTTAAGDAGYPGDIIIDHNTVIATSSYESFGITVNTGADLGYLVYKNNIVLKGSYGFWGQDSSEGINTLDSYYPAGYTFTKNAIIGGSSLKYPSGNYFPASVSAVGFVNFANDGSGDYRLSASSPYKNAGTDGKDLGADIDALELALNKRAFSAVLPPSGLHIVN